MHIFEVLLYLFTLCLHPLPTASSGTFAPEGDPISYGLVHPVNGFNTIYVQFFLYVDIFKKAWNTRGIANKFKAVLYGPGWVKGGPRMGDPSQLPEVGSLVLFYSLTC